MGEINPNLPTGLLFTHPGKGGLRDANLQNIKLRNLNLQSNYAVILHVFVVLTIGYYMK